MSDPGGETKIVGCFNRVRRLSASSRLSATIRSSVMQISSVPGASEILIL
jgi:hypothetical protein